MAQKKTTAVLRDSEKDTKVTPRVTPKVKELAKLVMELATTFDAIGYVLEAHGDEGASAYAHLEVGVDMELEGLRDFVTDWIDEREAAINGDMCADCEAELRHAEGQAA